MAEAARRTRRPPAASGRRRRAAHGPRGAAESARNGTGEPRNGTGRPAAVGRDVRRHESKARSPPGRTRRRTEGMAPARGTGDRLEGTDRRPRDGREEIEGIAATARIASRGTRNLRRPGEPGLPQTRRRDVRGRPTLAGTGDRGLEEPLRTHGRPVRPHPPRGPGRRRAVARRGRVQRRREDANQRGVALRDRTGARLDAANRPHVRPDEDTVHRRRRPRIPGHGGLAGTVRPEAPANGGGLRESHPDHAPRGGRRPVPGSYSGDDDAEPGIAGGSPRMSYVDDMRRELELLVKHHRDVPLPPEEVPDFRTFRCAEPAKDMIAVDGSYSFMLNLSSWWLALISVGLLRYAFDGHAFRRKDWRLVQRMVGVSTYEEFVATQDELHRSLFEF